MLQIRKKDSRPLGQTGQAARAAGLSKAMVDFRLSLNFDETPSNHFEEHVLGNIKFIRNYVQLGITCTARKHGNSLVFVILGKVRD